MSNPRASIRSGIRSDLSLSPTVVRWIVPVLVIGFTITAFFPVLNNGFVNWDDDTLLLRNPNYRGLGWTQLRWMFTTTYMGHYRPLTWITFGLDYLIGGMDPRGYHLTNLLFHCANAVLFYFVALRLLRLAMPTPAAAELPLRLAAGFAALIFSLHPLRVEAVAWVSGRKDLVSSQFLLLAILCYLRAAAGEEVPRKRWMIAAVMIYAFSLLAKGIGMTLPVILLILDVYPLRRLGSGPGKWFGPEARQVWWEKVPFFVLALTAGLIAPVAQYQLGAMRTLGEHGIIARLAQTLYGLAFYLWKTIVPISLSPLYELRIHFKVWDWPFVLSGGAVIGTTLALLAIRQQWPAGLATWAYYGMMLAPVLGIAQVGVQLVADRYTYLSCLGWAILAGAGIVLYWNLWVSSRIARPVFLFANGVAALILLCLVTLTWKQVQVWKDSESLWRHVLKISEQSAYAHNNLGSALASEEKLDEAIAHFHQALRIDPGFTTAHYYLGNVLAKQGKLEEAKYHYQEALRLDPGFAGAHYNLANILAKQGKLEEAKYHLRQAVRQMGKGPRPIRRGPADGS